MRSIEMLLTTLSVAALALGGCVGGGSSGGSGGSGGGGGADGGPSGAAACEATGPALEMPAAPQLALTADADGYVALQEEGGFASGEWATWVIGPGDPIRFDGGIGRTPIALASGPSGAVGVSLQLSPLEPRVRLRRWQEMHWTAEEADRSGELDGQTIFVGAGDLAVGAAGDAAVVWLHADIMPDSRDVTAYAIVQRDGAFSAQEAVFTPDDALSDNEIHAAVGADGAVHVLAHQYVDEAVGLIYRRRGPDGAWGPIVQVGPAPGTLGNITITGIVATADGSVYAAEAHGSSGVEDRDGGVVVYRIDGDSAERIGAVDDPRFVASGLAMAPLGDRVVLAVTHGENNFDPAESDDSVDLYVCDTGGCSLAARPSTVRGVFYGSVAVATRGDEVAVLWAQEPKRDIDAPEANFLMRLDCP